MRSSIRAVLSVLSAVALTAVVDAQGSDNCATAQVISGVGTFPYVNAGQTTGAEGQGHMDCTYFGDTTIHRDVWFAWTAPSTNRYLIDTCGLTTFDTKMAIYAGSGCPSGAPLMCNDDYCDSQSAVVFDAVAGSTYTLQLGSSSSSSSGGNGSFRIAVAPPLVTCGPATGPDLIVGAMPGISNYTASGGFDMVSVSTTACNIGSQIANWIDQTNDHPVIRQNVYKHALVGGASRFEQLGMSWLKHGFGSAQDSTCCTCQPGGNFFHLGVGCADTYSSGQNGAQFGVGPNWQVNAHTGVFTFPPADPPFTGSPARRCQMAISSLAPTSGTTRFFEEVQYVTKDDAAAGNQNNNASWHELFVSGGPSNYTFSFTGSLHPQESAIHAWVELDPGVTLTNAQIPGDGLIVVGSRATQTGPGTWHYEYAVYNMNADRNVGVFSVPITPAIAVSSIAFHDVAYHDGDGNGSVNVSGLDWTATQSATALRWASETEAANVNANAIRWGTLYNFRFDANVPPQTGSITFEPWKAGSPSTLSATAQVPAPSAISSYCFGDGSGAACPCGNDSSPGAQEGCRNSLGSGGKLIASGSAHLSSDAVLLSGSGMPDSSALYFQGTTQTSGGAGAVFGDGLRCAGGSVMRLATKINVLGNSRYPEAGDASVSVRGGIAAPGDYTYQVWYRNAAAFCNPETFNLTNGVAITWAP